MSYTKQSGDPRQMSARFSSTCHTCGEPIKKGEQIIYWPNGKTAGHFACDQDSFQKSVESFIDEQRYYDEIERMGGYR
jgi:hypothetical protein